MFVFPDSDTMLDKKLELGLLRKSMPGSAGPCSPGFCLGATEQSRPDRQAFRPTVDSTLSDMTTGATESAHTPACMEQILSMWPRQMST